MTDLLLSRLQSFLITWAVVVRMPSSLQASTAAAIFSKVSGITIISQDYLLPYT